MSETQRQGVLITGGSGFLGRALVEKLLADGCPRICIYSRNEYAQARMRADFGDDARLRWLIGDVRDVERLERAMQSVYSVIHAAALKRIEVGQYNPEEMVKTNVYGSMNVIRAARRAGVTKALLVSSDKAYQPVSPYGQSKAMAESLFLTANEQRGPQFAVVRYGNVAGSTGSVIPTWRARAERGEAVRMTNPECTRFWMDRADAAKLVVDTLVSMSGGELAIPDLPAFRLGDLAEAMDVRHEVTRLGAFEKLHESMDETRSSETAPRLTVEELQCLLGRVAHG
jgi:UDP-N-acetylglucosamine 4,6-dehydratase